LSDNAGKAPSSPLNYMDKPKVERRVSAMSKRQGRLDTKGSSKMSQRTMSEISLDSFASFNKEGARIAP